MRAVGQITKSGLRRDARHSQKLVIFRYEQDPGIDSCGMIATACTEPTGQLDRPSRLDLSHDSTRLEAGDTARVVALIAHTGEQLHAATVTWRSSNPAIATVQDGLVTGKATDWQPSPQRPPGFAMVLEPGAVVCGFPAALLFVSGDNQLLGAGTSARPITFSAVDTVAGWQGITTDISVIGGAVQFKHIDAR